MKFIVNWKRAPRMLSVQAMSAAGALQVTWAQLPDDMRSSFPPHLIQWLTVAILALGVFGRLVQQDSTDAKP